MIYQVRTHNYLPYTRIISSDKTECGEHIEKIIKKEKHRLEKEMFKLNSDLLKAETAAMIVKNPTEEKVYQLDLTIAELKKEINLNRKAIHHVRTIAIEESVTIIKINEKKLKNYKSIFGGKDDSSQSES